MAVVAHRLDAEFGEAKFPLPYHRCDLGHRPPHGIHVRAARNRSDMRQACDPGQTAAAEVEAIELDLRRTVGGSRRNDQRTHRIRLTRLRSADDRHVAARSGDIDGENVAPLVVRAVHDADREHQPTDLRGSPVRGQHVDGGRLTQRRQPHLMRRTSLPGDAVHHDLEQRSGVRCGPFWITGRVGAGHLGRNRGHDGVEWHRAGGEHLQAHRAARRRVVLGARRDRRRVRTRHVTRVESNRFRRITFEVARSRHVGQVVGIGYTEY